MRRGLFITFEGPDFSGKTTISKLLYERIQNSPSLIKLFNGIIQTREPGGKNLEIAEKIRNLIFYEKDLDIFSELLLFEAARNEHLTKVIIPALKENEIVLCDRFLDSSFIYQGVLGGLEWEKIDMLNKMVASSFYPDLTFVLKLDYQNAMQRMKKRNLKQNKFDIASLANHEKIMDAYLKLAKDDKRFIVIDANGGLEVIVQNIYNEVEKWVQKHQKSI